MLSTIPETMNLSWPKRLGRQTQDWLNFADGLRWIKNPYAYLDAKAVSHGLTFRDRLPVLGKALFTGDPEFINRITTDPVFQDKKSYSSLAKVLGERSLIALGGEEHRSRRLALSHGFRSSVLSKFDRFGRPFVREILRSPQVNASAFLVAKAISLRTTIRALFALHGGEELKLIELVESFMSSFQSPLVLFVPGFKVEMMGFSPWGRAMNNRRELVDFLRQLLHRTEAIGSSESMMTQFLPELRKLGCSDDDVIGELIALLMFGHDTTATGLAWALTYLANDPASIARIRTEAESAGVESDLLNYSKLEFTEACLNESLRISPPIVHVNRVVLESVSLGRFDLDHGDAVLPCTYLAHHNPEVFASPKKFQPERFLKDIPKGAFFPYGLGARICIGKPLAQRQMVLTLAAIVLESDIAMASEYSLRPERRFVLMCPEGGGRVRFRLRSQSQ